MFITLSTWKKERSAHRAVFKGKKRPVTVILHTSSRNHCCVIAIEKAKVNVDPSILTIMQMSHATRLSSDSNMTNGQSNARRVMNSQLRQGMEMY